MAEITLQEMLGILDDARGLREDRELLQRVLNQDQLRQQLRERLLNSVRLTGDAVTEDEVEAAISVYFARQHVYRRPRWTPLTWLAYLYIHRHWAFAFGGVALLMAVLFWLTRG